LSRMRFAPPMLKTMIADVCQKGREVKNVYESRYVTRGR